jgi:hypothetical protein
LLHHLSMSTVVDFYSAIWPDFTPPLTETPVHATCACTDWLYPDNPVRVIADVKKSFLLKLGVII